MVEWLKQPGDRVERGDVIAVVDTQKGAIEIKVFEAGVLDRILVQPGEKVPMGTPMATMRSYGAAQEPEPAPPPEAPPQLERPPPGHPPEAPPQVPPPPEQPPVEIPERDARGRVRVRSSPAARRRRPPSVSPSPGCVGRDPRAPSPWPTSRPRLLPGSARRPPDARRAPASIRPRCAGPETLMPSFKRT